MTPIKAINRCCQGCATVRGITLVEVLIAIAVFGIASVGMYFVMQSMITGVQTTMHRNVEAAFANMLIGEVNPFDPAIETGYDVTTKTAFSLPDGDSVYYTRLVDSADGTADVKQIHVYLYRTSTSSSAYRKFKREIMPQRYSLNLGGSTYYKDALGNGWAPCTSAFSNTDGSRASGYSGSAPTTNTTASAIASSVDDTLFQSAHTAATLTYKLLGTLNQKYKVSIGYAEITAGVTAGQRIMNVAVNGTSQGTFDARSEAGALNSALVKTYIATATDDGTGVGIVTVALTQGSGATLNPAMAIVSMVRQDLN